MRHDGLTMDRSSSSIDLQNMKSEPVVKGQPAQTYLTLDRCCTRDLNAILWVGEQMMSRKDKPNVSTIRFCDFARRVTETYVI